MLLSTAVISAKVDRSLRFGASLAQCDSITDETPPVRHASVARHILLPDRGVPAVSRSSTGTGETFTGEEDWRNRCQPGPVNGRKTRGKANRAK